MLVVVVDVPATGVTGGDRGAKDGLRASPGEQPSGRLPFASAAAAACCESMIFRSDSRVRKGCGLCSEVEESEADGSSSMGGGMERVTI